MDWENHLEKNPMQKKSKKNSKNQSEIDTFEQKNQKRESEFLFKHYFKIRAKKFYAAKTLAFSFHFLFRRDENRYSNLTSKIMKKCEQIFKKRQEPQYNSNSLNCKKESA